MDTFHAVDMQKFALLTNKWKIRFDYRKLLNKKILLKTFFLIE